MVTRGNAGSNASFLPTIFLRSSVTRPERSVSSPPSNCLITTVERFYGLGPSVISYHRQAPYVGWDKFKPELLGMTKALFDANPAGILITRWAFAT